jgi:hypothetical protein
MRFERRDAGVIAALAALKVAAMLWALHCGFAQVSDDDYARTVIAQTFAHAPKLDPSGTSWLPFPFWLYGGVMMVVGRSLTAARAIAFVLGLVGPAIAYAGLRSMQIARIPAAAGAALAALTPWSVWLGLAPVPEGWAGACAAAALFFLAGERAFFAAALALIASLSRYETWPIAAFVAAVCVVRARRDRVSIVAALVAISGVAFWMVNNAVAHGDPLHFLARVAAFRRASGAMLGIGERILEYPLALVHDAPEIAAFGAIAAGVASRDRALRARWVLPLAGAGFVLAFLIYGDLRDGAPTHHAARALVPIFGVLAGFAADAIATPARPRVAVPVAIATLAFVLFRARDVPGASPAERRDAQIARGRELAKTAPALDVTPCAYEHFALITAYGAPENVTIEPRTGAPVTSDCPSVSAR